LALGVNPMALFSLSVGRYSQICDKMFHGSPFVMKVNLR
jgi:hypothetical protein